MLAYDYRASTRPATCTSWSTIPTIPSVPGIITFDRPARRFVATRLYDTDSGPIRAFRMYYGPLL